MRDHLRRPVCHELELGGVDQAHLAADDQPGRGDEHPQPTAGQGAAFPQVERAQRGEQRLPFRVEQARGERRVGGEHQEVRRALRARGAGDVDQAAVLGAEVGGHVEVEHPLHGALGQRGEQPFPGGRRRGGQRHAGGQGHRQHEGARGGGERGEGEAGALGLASRARRRPGERGVDQRGPGEALTLAREEQLAADGVEALLLEPEGSGLLPQQPHRLGVAGRLPSIEERHHHEEEEDRTAEQREEEVHGAGS